MNNEDIANAYMEFSRVHEVTPLILEAQLSPQTLVSIDAHKADLNEVIGTFDDVVAYYGNMKNMAMNARKKLERDFEDSKARYWSIKKQYDRNPTQQ